jgi:hypothetical protein
MANGFQSNIQRKTTKMNDINTQIEQLIKIGVILDASKTLHKLLNRTAEPSDLAIRYAQELVAIAQEYKSINLDIFETKFATKLQQKIADIIAETTTIAELPYSKLQISSIFAPLFKLFNIKEN